MTWSEGNNIGIVTECSAPSDFLIHQEEDHVLPGHSWWRISETTESKTMDKGKLLCGLKINIV